MISFPMSLPFNRDRQWKVDWTWVMWSLNMLKEANCPEYYADVEGLVWLVMLTCKKQYTRNVQNEAAEALIYLRYNRLHTWCVSIRRNVSCSALQVEPEHVMTFAACFHHFCLYVAVVLFPSITHKHVLLTPQVSRISVSGHEQGKRRNKCFTDSMTCRTGYIHIRLYVISFR
jgi:hypothetical protein